MSGEESVVVFDGELGVNGEPYLTVLFSAWQAEGDFDAFARAWAGLDVLSVLILG